MNVSAYARLLFLAGLLLSFGLTGEREAKAGEIAVQAHQVGGVDLALLSVERTSGNILTVKWEYRNKTKEKKQLTDQRTGWIDPYRLSSDMYLLDNKHRVKYTVLVDETKHPVAGKHAGQNEYVFVGPKQTLTTWAKFQAPPADVDKLTISIPGVAPFEDVPITTPK
jgi:hypothetical protein